MSARVIRVIEVIVKRGCGITYCLDPHHEHQPIRRVRQYFSFDGDLLAEEDPDRSSQRAYLRGRFPPETEEGR